MIAALLLLPMTLCSQDLSKHRWENRLLLILTVEQNHPLVQKQLDELQENRQGVEERRLLTYLITPERYQLQLDGEKWQPNSAFTKYSSGKAYEVVVGLDGSIKQRKFGLFKASKLFSIIDSMPMRQAEMRGN